MELAGDCGANMIYSMLGWSPHFLAKAQARGLTIVTEFYVRPSFWRVHQQEHLKFPEWEAKMPYAESNPSLDAKRGTCNFSDYLITPTQAVKDDIVSEGLFERDRIHVVPYGIGQAFFEIENRPAPGKVLFAGSCIIVKGIHYFAKASQQVMKDAGHLVPQFIAAGEVTDLVRQQSVCSHVTFLGRVPRREINHLYTDVDLLVFPSLSDSFGMVILEAMAAGIPVICSPYCADVVEDGVSGFVVEPRDTEALANAISKIIHDRPLRDRMSRAAKERARQFTREQHGQKLVKTLQGIHSVKV
jgi:glycosyltransferase involved in cell wall biosynthesis